MSSRRKNLRTVIEELQYQMRCYQVEEEYLERKANQFYDALQELKLQITLLQIEIRRLKKDKPLTTNQKELSFLRNENYELKQKIAEQEKTIKSLLSPYGGY
jgi:FtsZ-binding cell division protein ZapB